MIQSNKFALLFNELLSSSTGLILIKSTSNFSLTDICDECDNKSIKHYYKKFNQHVYTHPYEPFCSIIKETFCNVNVLVNLFDNVTLYAPHKEIFTSYIFNEKATREEDVIPFDYKYEKSRMYEALLNIFNYSNTTDNMFILLEDLNSAPYSTLQWIKWLICNNKSLNFRIIASINSYKYHDSKYQNDFDDLIEILEIKQLILEVSESENSLDTNFLTPSEESIVNLLEIAENHFQFFALEESLNYLLEASHQVNKNFNSESYSYITGRLGDICLLLENSDNSYKYYNLLLTQALEKNNLSLKITALQKLSMLYITKGKFNSAEKLAKQSYKLASKLENELFILKSYILLFWINEKGKYRTTIEKLGFEENFIKFAKKYNYLNSLAYFLTHSFNTISYVGDDQREDYYNEGYKLAERLGNHNCVLSSHLKTALVYAVRGHYDVAVEYYKKVEDLLVSMNDYFRLAQTFNGIGYYYMTSGDYIMANSYYDKSLKNLKLSWNFDEICMCLVNKGLNSMLAYDYTTAETCFEILQSVITVLKLARLRLSTISRLHGIIALNHFYLGNTYRCHSFLSKMESNLAPNIHHDDDDEYFLFFFVKGLLYKKDGLKDKALTCFNEASCHLANLEGSLKCFYPKFVLEYYDLLKDLNQLTEALILKEDAITFCKSHNYKLYLDLLENKPLAKLSLGENLSYLTWIVEAARQQTNVDLLTSKMDEINFLNSFQENLTSMDDLDNVVTNSMTLLQNKFSLDYLLLILHGSNNNEILYSSHSQSLSTDSMLSLNNILKKHKEPLISSKSSINVELNSFFEDLTNSEIQSLIYIPVLKDSKVRLSFVCLTNIDKDVVNTQTVLNVHNQKLMNLAIKQLNETIQRIKWEEKLILSASTDMLTGLYNRQAFYNNLTNLLKSSTSNTKSVSLFYIDLDNFKYYNDTFGHNIGDLLLIWFGEILKSIISSNDIAVRYGGDEFLLLLVDSNKDIANKTSITLYNKLQAVNGFSDKISDILDKPVLIPSNKLLSCSIGIVTKNVDTSFNTNQLINDADNLLYEAKRSGKNKYIINTNS